MISGFDTALGEITLVLFTTLAPSGAVALIVLACLLLAGRVSGEDRVRVDKFLCVPLVVSMVGLVASATHLGNPANALYVFLGVGRSPLSTEVFCAVVFLLFAGVYWLYSFSVRPVRALQQALLALIVASGAAFVTAVAFAYAADTIVTWDTVYVPAALWANALVGGPLLAVATLCAAKWRPVGGRFGWAMAAVSGVALAANVAVYALQGAALQQTGNAMAEAIDLVPAYWPMLAAFAVLAGAGLATWARTLRAVACEARLRGEAGRRALYGAAAACVLAFAGIFVMRFAFYMMHMTVGLGV